MVFMFKNKILLLLLLISIWLGIYRIIPFFDVNIAFWYDPGLYRLLFVDYINNLPNINFDNLSWRDRSAYPPFLGFLWNILYIIGFNVDNLLSFWLGFFSVITWIFIYLNLKKYSKITWIIGVILFMISVVQYKSFAMNYYKQIIWVIFFLAIFYLFEKKKYLLSIPLVISVFTIHRPSGLFFLLVFVVYKIFDFIKYRNEKKYLEKNIKKKGNKEKFDNTMFTYKDVLFVLLSWIVALLMYLPLFQELILNLIKPLTTTIASSGPSWSFFSVSDFIKYSYLFIVISLYWFYLKIKNKDFDYIFIWYLVWALWIILKLFFYNRFLIFFDIFVILLAAYSFGIIFKENKKLFYFLFIWFFFLQSYFYYNYVSSNNKAEISQIELDNIKKINTIVPENSMLMVNSRSRSAWLAWYTLKPVIAPWLFEYDKWTLDDWKKWWLWDWKVKCELLDTYKDLDRPVYIWMTKFYMWWKFYKENLKGWDCFEKTDLKGKDFRLYKINFNK